MTDQRTLVTPSHIPDALLPYHQFVCWQYINTGRAKPDKVPTNPFTLGNAGVGWPNTWSDVDTAIRAYERYQHLSGIGFVLTKNDPFSMLDLDGCLHGDDLSALAMEVMERLDTYAERSPSGRGLRLFVRCECSYTLKRPEIEIYSAGRWATLTGDVVYDRPVAIVTNLDWLMERYQRKEVVKPTALLSQKRAALPADDSELWQRIFNKNHLAYQLYTGNIQASYGDESRAVILLLNSLALWTSGDAARMERMIRQSNLNQAKWDDKRGNITWLQGRVLDAINYMRNKG